MPLEIEWYEKHGRYPSRIAMSRSVRSLQRIRGQYMVVHEPAESYVIGDWSWNRSGRPFEEIEPAMRRARIYHGT